MHLDPVINSALTVLNGAMLLTLVVVITLGRRRARKRTQAPTLLTDGRECWLFCRRLSAPAAGYLLKAISQEDRL